MAADEKWYFTKEELSNTHSIKCGYDVDRELSCRQQAAHLIQDMGQRLQVYPCDIVRSCVFLNVRHCPSEYQAFLRQTPVT